MPTLAESLHATLKNAVEAPYYRKSFGRRWKDVRTVDGLADLPILDKRTAIAHQSELVVGEAPPGYGVSSSGTTRADVDLPPLNVLTNTPEELEAQGMGPDGAPRDEEIADDPWPGWTLVSVAVTHGLPLGGPGHDEIFLPWMHDRNALYMLETVLSKPQGDGRRVTAARISVGALKTFTAWLLERGKDPAAFGVKLIGTNSFRLSPFWRALIEEKWGAMVFDNYSLSEFATAATECKACGWLHFGWPPVIYEVLDLVTGKRIDKGAGRLLMTGVYPFVQKMPLIRYDTGDVIELGPRCRATGARGVRLLGRTRRGLIVDDHGKGTYAAAPCFIQDALEARPETERNPHPLHTLGVLKTHDLGLPRFTVEREKDRALLRFEVRFDPHIYEAAARQIARDVRADVLKHDKALAALVRKERLVFECQAVASRSLAPPPDKYD